MNKLLLFASVATALLLGSCSSKKTAEQSATPESFKVISYNIRMTWAAETDGENRWENRREASLKMIDEQKPLVMGLQEACPVQLQYLDSALTIYKHIGVGRDDGKLEGETMAIYYDTTRVDLGENGTFWLSETPDSVSQGWDAACRRTCTWGVFTLKSNGKKFCYFNTHFDHIGQVARRESIKLMVAKIKEIADKDMPVVLTADFNSVTTDSIFLPLKDYMKDARVACNPTDTLGTFNGFGKIGKNPDGSLEDVVIDHIFFLNLKPVKFEVLRGNYGVPYISDHYPLVFTTEL